MLVSVNGKKKLDIIKCVHFQQVTTQSACVIIAKVTEMYFAVIMIPMLAMTVLSTVWPAKMGMLH